MTTSTVKAPKTTTTEKVIMGVFYTFLLSTFILGAVLFFLSFSPVDVGLRITGLLFAFPAIFFFCKATGSKS